MTSPERFTEDVVAYAENANGFPPDIAYGWHLEIAGEIARWRECSDADSCSAVERERLACDLLATEAAGRAQINGADVAVLRLTLRSRRRNHMPQSP